MGRLCPSAPTPEPSAPPQPRGPVSSRARQTRAPPAAGRRGRRGRRCAGPRPALRDPAVDGERVIGKTGGWDERRRHGLLQERARGGPRAPRASRAGARARQPPAANTQLRGPAGPPRRVHRACWRGCGRGPRGVTAAAHLEGSFPEPGPQASAAGQLARPVSAPLPAVSVGQDPKPPQSPRGGPSGSNSPGAGGHQGRLGPSFRRTREGAHHVCTHAH